MNAIATGSSKGKQDVVSHALLIALRAGFTSISYKLTADQPSDPEACKYEHTATYTGTDGQQYDLVFSHDVRVNLATRKYAKLDIGIISNARTKNEL